ncbi:MAG: hypothetical protein ACXWJ5_14530 [Xanthobacteraceae bacterium]
MKRVAVFGNAGGGKSTLARRLAEITDLPLHVIDLMQFRSGGDKIPHEEFLTAHAALLRQDKWIIDGYGSVALAWERFDVADTLVYVDLPLATHHWFVTKRLLKGLFADPEGWPENSPLWSSTMDSYKVLWLCHLRLTPKIPAACRRHDEFETSSSPQIQERRFDFPQCRQARICESDYDGSIEGGRLLKSCRLRTPVPMPYNTGIGKTFNQWYRRAIPMCCRAADATSRSVDSVTDGGTDE